MGRPRPHARCRNLWRDGERGLNEDERTLARERVDEVFRAALAVVGPGRILFGTDSSYFPRGWQRGVYEEQKAALDRIGVAAADQDAIFGGNFDRLFGEKKKA